MQALLIQYWPILLPAALGMLALYLLLPRAQRFPPLYGAACAALALLAGGYLLIRDDWVPLEAVLFYTFAGLAILFGGMMITHRNPVHAALCFAMVVLSTCGLFLLQAAPFLMAATIIIYAGAIVVTFLFVIMLAQQAGLSSADQRSREPFLASVAGFVLLGSLLCMLSKNYTNPKGDDLDRFIDQTKQATKVSTVKEWQEVFVIDKDPRNDNEFFDKFRNLVDPTGEQHTKDTTRIGLSNAIQKAQQTWNILLPLDEDDRREAPPDKIRLFKEELAEVYQWALRVRHGYGSLRPNARPLSTSTGAAPSAVLDFKDGKPVERLPAANVAGLGKALFTDYLLAVELAGTLLLVATIGAIAIAGRRAEGLR